MRTTEHSEASAGHKRRRDQDGGSASTGNDGVARDSTPTLGADAITVWLRKPLGRAHGLLLPEKDGTKYRPTSEADVIEHLATQHVSDQELTLWPSAIQDKFHALEAVAEKKAAGSVSRKPRKSTPCQRELAERYSLLIDASVEGAGAASDSSVPATSRLGGAPIAAVLDNVSKSADATWRKLLQGARVDLQGASVSAAHLASTLLAEYAATGLHSAAEIVPCDAGSSSDSATLLTSTVANSAWLPSAVFELRHGASS